ncbi:Guanine nucleotide-binding protein alpha-2 subunit [Sorochytrium milnesiophthora]
MGLCASAEDKSADLRTLNIDKQLALDAEKLKKECKILLLGSGESGKSTIVKQMKIIHQNGYTREELIGFRSTIFNNMVDSMRGFLDALKSLELAFQDARNTDLAERFMELYYARKIDTDAPQLMGDVVDMIDGIWKDGVVSAAMARTSDFFAEVRRLGSPDYIPSEQDVLRARVKTTGIIETRFTMNQLQIHMFDVGGQRSERKKWIHCFEAVTSIIFCVALSEYDQTLLEDANQNRMAESLVLFDSVINSRWFLRTSIILFLNKVDLFKDKLTKVPLSKYFEDYQGGEDLNKAAKFVWYKFTLLNRAKLKIYPHMTCATDTSNIRLVFAAVRDTILANALKDSGIL